MFQITNQFIFIIISVIKPSHSNETCLLQMLLAASFGKCPPHSRIFASSDYTTLNQSQVLIPWNIYCSVTDSLA